MVKLDSSRRLLRGFIDLNNLASLILSAEDRKRIGVHTCPGGTAIPPTRRCRLRRAVTWPVRVAGGELLCRPGW